MTKQNLTDQFQIAELVSLPAFQAMIAYLRANVPRKKGLDATQIINSQGYMEGWMDAVDEMASVHQRSPQLPRAEKQPYSEPSVRMPKEPTKEHVQQ